MKKFLTAAAALCLLLSPAAFAQDKGFHIGVAPEIGLDGVGADIAIQPILPFLQLRGGFSFVPYTYKSKTFEIKEVELINNYRANGEISVNVHPNFDNIHVLADLYPFSKSSFHLTVGGYFGLKGDDGLVRISTGQPIPLEHLSGGKWEPAQNDYGKTGLELKDSEGNQRYIVTTDTEGYLHANIAMGKPLENTKLPSVYPYLGIGFGRPFAGNRVSFNFDLGVLYCGKYTINVMGYSPSKFEAYDEAHWYSVERDDINNLLESVAKDKRESVMNVVDKVYPWLEKLPVAPMMRFSLFIKII
jgi:hypothetical protein